MNTSACSNHEMPCTQMQFTEYCNKIPCSVLSVGSKPGLVNDFFRARNQQSQHARIFSHANLHPYGCCAPSGGILRVPGFFRNFSIFPKMFQYEDIPHQSHTITCEHIEALHVEPSSARAITKKSPSHSSRRKPMRTRLATTHEGRWVEAGMLRLGPAAERPAPLTRSRGA